MSYVENISKVVINLPNLFQKLQVSWRDFRNLRKRRLVFDRQLRMFEDDVYSAECLHHEQLERRYSGCSHDSYIAGVESSRDCLEKSRERLEKFKSQNKRPTK